MGNEGKIDAVALRRLREIKGFSRKEASVLLGIGYKTVEKFENGRTNLKRPRIEQIVGAYGLTYGDFLLCREGKSEQIEKKFCHKKEKVIDNKQGRRFYKKVITKEVQVLQVLRKLKGLSQYKASFVCGYNRTAIGYIENGRIELHRAKISHIVKSYGFTMEDFDYHMKAEVFVTEIQDECISIIKELRRKEISRLFTRLLLTFASINFKKRRQNYEITFSNKCKQEELQFYFHSCQRRDTKYRS